MDGVTVTPTDAWSVIDLIALVGLVLSVIVGAWRGLVSELLSLAAWAVSYVAAQWLGPTLAAHVPVGEPGGRVNVLSGMLVAFVLAWLAWALLSWAITQMLRESPLSGPDRLLGGGFGLLRGVLVGLVIVTLVNMTPMAKWAPWHASRSVVWLEVLLQGLAPVLPEQVVKFLPAQS